MTRSSWSGDGEIFSSGRQFLFSYEMTNCIFDNVLVIKMRSLSTLA